VDDPTHVCLVSRRMAGGSLWDALLSKHAPLTPAQRLLIALCTARGLAALHAAGQVHHDVKSGNVLLSADSRAAVLADCGASFALPPGAGELLEAPPTGENRLYPCWSPEFVTAGLISPAGDVYGLGVVLLELLSSRCATMPSVAAQGLAATMLPLILAGRPDAVADPSVVWPAGVASTMAALASSCLRTCASERPTAQEVAQTLARACAAAGVDAPPDCESCEEESLRTPAAHAPRPNRGLPPARPTGGSEAGLEPLFAPPAGNRRRDGGSAAHSAADRPLQVAPPEATGEGPCGATPPPARRGFLAVVAALAPQGGQRKRRAAAEGGELPRPGRNGRARRGPEEELCKAVRRRR